MVDRQSGNAPPSPERKKILQGSSRSVVLYPLPALGGQVKAPGGGAPDGRRRTRLDFGVTQEFYR